MVEPGTVWLVGAGPGDPDLLTRKAERLIGAASIVFHDALIGPGILAMIPAHARRVPVGKRSGWHSKDQASINDLLLAAALDGERVVRLKGGDPSVFGRSGEEIGHLRAAGVPVHVCPGLTSASAAAASACTSLTLRGFARRLQLVTAHARAGEALDLDWTALADPKVTLAVYMGRAAAPEIARELMAHGLSGSTPVLIATDVSLPRERMVFTRLDLLPLTVASVAGESPALLLIGEAMRAGASGRTEDIHDSERQRLTGEAKRGSD